MPANVVVSFADKTGKSVGDVEKLWDKAQDIVKKEYPDVEPESEKFFALVTGILKKMLKIESTASTTVTTANVGTGQSGQFKKRMFSTFHRAEKKKKKNIDG